MPCCGTYLRVIRAFLAVLESFLYISGSESVVQGLLGVSETQSGYLQAQNYFHDNSVVLFALSLSFSRVYSEVFQTLHVMTPQQTECSSRYENLTPITLDPEEIYKTMLLSSLKFFICKIQFYQNLLLT